jgi:hypothetical protein
VHSTGVLDTERLNREIDELLAQETTEETTT